MTFLRGKSRWDAQVGSCMETCLEFLHVQWVAITHWIRGVFNALPSIITESRRHIGKPYMTGVTDTGW